MSTQYPGGFITKSPVAPTTTAASGIWTVDQALQYVKAGTWPTPPLFIEDLFSTYLYTGNGSTQTITNGIDLAGKGGMVWIKDRTTATYSWVVDTNRGFTKGIKTQTTGAEQTSAAGKDVTAFLSTGFSLGPDGAEQTNTSADNFVSWTFAKQPKFFDIVTYTGTGAAGNVSHSLGTTPGFLIIKRINSVGNWVVFARDGTSSSKYTYSYFNTSAGLNLPAVASAINIAAENSGYITSTTFDPNNLSGSGAPGNVDNINDSGVSYIAYLFAHDAGGFPANGGGSTNGISCGSFTTDGSGNATTTLGYEPQFVMRKRTDVSEGWQILDNMRGWCVSTNDDNMIQANTAGAEITGGDYGTITSTGFTSVGSFSARYIYIAIRRGPMKTPTVGTSVFSPNQVNAGPLTAVTTGFPVDLQLAAYTGVVNDKYAYDRLRGISTSSTVTSTKRLITNLTDAEGTVANDTASWNNTGFLNAGIWASVNSIFWNFRRAPSFFDEVCYTGTGSATTFSHNLGVAPELMIVKSRSAVNNWVVYSQSIASGNVLFLNGTAGSTAGTTSFNSTAPTASVFTVGTNSATNGSGATLVNYLFATCAGVSKVGSYTGTAALQTVACGFTTGARFVLIKRTDTNGDWYVWDSARGISSGNDPYLLLNSTATQVTATNYVDTTSTGFQVTAAALTTVNISAASYIFLAIA